VTSYYFYTPMKSPNNCLFVVPANTAICMDCHNAQSPLMGKYKGGRGSPVAGSSVVGASVMESLNSDTMNELESFKGS